MKTWDVIECRIGADGRPTERVAAICTTAPQALAEASRLLLASGSDEHAHPVDRLTVRIDRGGYQSLVAHDVRGTGVTPAAG